MSTIVVRLTAETWKAFPRRRAARQRVRTLLRLAIMQLLGRLHTLQVSPRHVQFTSQHARPLRTMHFLQGKVPPRAGGLSPPQWLLQVRTPVVATLCVTPRIAGQRVTLVIHALDAEKLRTDLLAVAQAVEMLRATLPAPAQPPAAIPQPPHTRQITLRRNTDE